MRTLLFLFILCLMPLAAQALDVESLTQAQRDELVARLQSPKPVEVRIREEATQWAALGTSIGQAMLGAAKEIGVAAADFAQTPLGKIVTIVIVVKVIGGTVLHLMVSAGLLIVAAVFFLYIHRRVLMRPQYKSRPVLWGLCMWRTIESYESNDDLNSDGRAALYIFSIVIPIALIIGAAVSAITAI